MCNSCLLLWHMITVELFDKLSRCTFCDSGGGACRFVTDIDADLRVRVFFSNCMVFVISDDG